MCGEEATSHYIPSPTASVTNGCEGSVKISLTDFFSTEEDRLRNIFGLLVPEVVEEEEEEEREVVVVGTPVTVEDE